MTTQTRTQPQDAESSGTYTPVSEVRDLSKDDLLGMESPDALVEDGTAMFAVAARDGVMTLVEDGFEYETVVVLYLTADATHAVERHYRRGLRSAPRACIVPEGQLAEAGPGARSRAELVHNHPEVENV